MGVTDTPTWDNATKAPTKNTTVPETEISISLNSCETDWSECRSARSVIRRVMRASQRAAIRIATKSNAESNVLAPRLASQPLNLAVASA